AAARAAKGVRVATCRLLFARERTWIATSDGLLCERLLPLVNAGVRVLAVKGRRSEVRTAPARGGGLWVGGVEMLARRGLVPLAGRAGAEAALLLDAPPCPAGTRDLVLDPWIAARLLHETLGHALTGGEPSFLARADLGKRRVASPAVNLYQDP